MMSTESFPHSPSEFAQSELFQRTFSEGMGLVEEAAEFLEGPGRDSSKELSRDAALAYAGESMRLTTRLMQMASWLLVHRAVREGEMSSEEARAERYRLLGDDHKPRQEDEALAQLPAPLINLVERCDRLYERMIRLDERLTERTRPAADPNPVARQLADLEAALLMQRRI